MHKCDRDLCKLWNVKQNTDKQIPTFKVIEVNEKAGNMWVSEYVSNLQVNEWMKWLTLLG